MGCFRSYPDVYNDPNEWGTNVSWPETNIFNDITNNALPAVSWVIPNSNNSDHPWGANTSKSRGQTMGLLGSPQSSTRWAKAATGTLQPSSLLGMTLEGTSTTSRRRCSTIWADSAFASPCSSQPRPFLSIPSARRKDFFLHQSHAADPKDDDD
jgi:hypothetical protein